MSENNPTSPDKNTDIDATDFYDILQSRVINDLAFFA